MKKSLVPTLLQDLATHAARIRNAYARLGREQFLSDELAKDAVLYNFITLGEITIRLGEPFHEQHPHVPWQTIILQRHIIAHGYDIVDWEKLTHTIEDDLPAFIAGVEHLVRTYGPPPHS